METSAQRNTDPTKNHGSGTGLSSVFEVYLPAQATPTTDTVAAPA